MAEPSSQTKKTMPTTIIPAAQSPESSVLGAGFQVEAVGRGRSEKSNSGAAAGSDLATGLGADVVPLRRHSEQMECTRGRRTRQTGQSGRDPPRE